MIYWGGNHQTIIPRMGACGSGTDPKGGSGGGAGSGGGSANVPIDAGKFDFLDDFKDWLKDNAGKLALGALAVGLLQVHLFTLRNEEKVVILQVFQVLKILDSILKVRHPLTEVLVEEHLMKMVHQVDLIQTDFQILLNM